MFRSKSERKERKLQKKIDQLSKEAFKLSTVNRMASAGKYAEADIFMQELISLKQSRENDSTTV